MNTQEAQKQFRKITDQLAEATRKHDQSIDTLKSAEQASDASYHALIEVRAKHEIEDASKKDVDDAENEVKAAEKKLAEAQTTFDTQSRVLELLGKKKRDARQAYISAVEADIANQVPVKVRLVFDAIETLENACGELVDFHKECMNLGYESRLGTPYTQRVNSLIPKPPALGGSGMNTRNTDDISKWKNKYKNLIKS